MESDRVTACLVIHNEAALLERCLRSIREVTTRILVVHDGPCTDDSLRICRSFGCKIYERPFIGEAEPHRAWLYAIVTTPWILQLDADEFLSEDLIAAMPNLVRQKEYDCYSFIWPYWDGTRYRTIGWPSKKALFRTQVIQFIAIPHEEVRVPMHRHCRSTLILHHQPNYENFTLSHFRKKGLRWIRVHARYLLRRDSALARYPRHAQIQPVLHAYRSFPWLKAPVIAFLTAAGSYGSGGYSQGLTGIRIAAFVGLYYFLLGIEIGLYQYWRKSLTDWW